MKAAALTACVGVLLCFAGCGVEDAMLKVEIEKTVQQHMQEQEELMKLYDIDKCCNFTISAETNGVRKGTVDIGLKNKQTGDLKTLTYEFSYDVGKEFVSVGVKNPMDAVKLLNLHEIMK